MRTWLSERFGLDVPVVCAPMAGAAAGELAAAVCRGGGLGMIGVGGAATPEWISDQCKIAGSAGRPFGVGLLAWLLADYPGQLDAVLAARPALVSVSYGPYPRHRPAGPGRGAGGGRGRRLGGHGVSRLPRGNHLGGRPGAAARGHRYQHRLRPGVRHRAAAAVATGVRRPRATKRVL